MGLSEKPSVKQAVLKYAKKYGLGVAGVGAGIGASTLFMSFKPSTENENIEKPDIYDAPQESTSVNDAMSFSDAFETARNEVGVNGFFVWHGKVFGTMYEQEYDKLSNAEKEQSYENIMTTFSDKHPNFEEKQTEQEPIIEHKTAEHSIPTVTVIHEEAPVANVGSDSLTFKDTFSLAREQVGPGGVFEYNGKLYNTYTKEEWSNMTDEDKKEFVHSANSEEVVPSDISYEDVDIVKIDGNDSSVIVDENQDTIVTQEDDTMQEPTANEQFLGEQLIDDGAGNQIKIGMFLVDGKEEIRVDSDNDGNYDSAMSNNGDGTLTITNENGETATMTQEEFTHAMGQFSEGVEPTNYDDDNIPTDFDNNSTDSDNDNNFEI